MADQPWDVNAQKNIVDSFSQMIGFPMSHPKEFKEFVQWIKYVGTPSQDEVQKYLSEIKTHMKI
ncbi:MAG: hypothetical protein HQ456_02115 [Polynucleobacter sp.]|jgi:hypothetical protein|nr:hypothetical protein [Polynucleobacter sp.]